MINKKNVNLIFYKPRTLFQKFKASFGYPVCSMGLLIGDYAYRFRKGHKYLQEIFCDDDERLMKKYFVIDSKFPVNKLKGEWRRELLQQKARQFDRLWIRLRCVKSLKYVLNQLPSKWHYKGDLLASVYLRKRTW